MCLNPLKGYINEKGEVIKVARSDSVFCRLEPDGKLKSYFDIELLQDGDITEYIDIPCRHCEECYTQMRLEWIYRATCEMQLHKSAIFVTLTYKDYNDGITQLPPVAEMVTDDGEILLHQTLRHRDFQLFMKRLRKQFPDRKIRYMVCGEYGSRTFRPHYHAIIYGLSLKDFPDCLIHNTNSHGDVLYSSVMFENIWNYGYCLLSSADNGTIAYVAGYVAKKFTALKSKDWYEYTHVVAPYIRSSNRPGLGSDYISSQFDKLVDEYDYFTLPAINDRSTPTKIKLWSSVKNSYTNLKFLELGLDNYTNRYYDSINRRVSLIDNRYKLLKTDMLKSDYNSSRKKVIVKKLNGRRNQL